MAKINQGFGVSDRTGSCAWKMRDRAGGVQPEECVRWPCWPETLRCRPCRVIPNCKNPLGNDRSKPAGAPLSQLPVLPDFHLRWADAVGRWKIVAAVQSLSRVRLSVTPWAAALQAPLSTGFPSQECWRGCRFPSPGVEPTSPASQAGSLALSP